MKKTVLFALLTLGTCTEKAVAQCSGSPGFTETFTSTSGWTTDNYTNHPATPYFEISGGAFRYGNANSPSTRCGRIQRVYRSLPGTLNNQEWTAECKFAITGGNCPAHIIMSFTAGNLDTWYSQTGTDTECASFAGGVTNQDAIYAWLNGPVPTSAISGPVTGGWSIYAGYKDGTTITDYASGAIPINANGTYYVRLQRTHLDKGLISVFSNAAMTTHVPGSPQCFDITPSTALSGLTHLQHGVSATGYCARMLAATIDDVKIYDGPSPCLPGLTSIITGNSQFCYGDPVTLNGSSSFSSSPLPIQYHVWIIDECDAGGFNIPGTTVWLPWQFGAPTGNYIIPDQYLECDKYYNIKLAVQNCGNVWAESVKKIHVPCKPLFRSTGNSAYCEGSTVHIGMNGFTGGGPYSYTWVSTVPTYSVIVSNSSNGQISTTPSVNTTYVGTISNTNGCTLSVTRPIIITPQNLSLNITTGKDAANNFIAYQSQDDDWKISNFPGQTVYTTPSSVPVVQAASVDPNSMANGWATSPNARWLTPNSYGDGPSFLSPATVYPAPGAKNSRYYYEYLFNLPVAYSNLQLHLDEIAADNTADVYINTDALTTGDWTNNRLYELDGTNTFPTSCFTTIHNPVSSPYTISTSDYFVGTNKLNIVVQNGGGPSGNYSYSGLLVKGSLTAQCTPTFRLAQPGMVDEDVAEAIGKGQDIVSVYSFYPNPATDQLNINYYAKPEDITKVVFLDMRGTVVFTETLDPASTNIALNTKDFPSGLYLVCVEKNGAVVRTEKIIVNH
ncbi:MAG: hypothetical protein K0S33_3502 [Bacteroidetes bacterium]|jgi:hypothetical protein|nr:hypothetical protein [Bacteroidota bacterium]